MPKVSVILTSYNHEKFVSKSIESVLNQTFKDFELIIWDDRSTDKSWKKIKKFKDPRIHAFRNKENMGGANINRALLESKGEYVAIAHSDDLWELQKLELQTEFLDNHPEIGAVFSYASIIDDEGKPLQHQNHFYQTIFEQPNRSRQEWLRYFFFSGNALCHPSVLIRKECYSVSGPLRNGLVQLPDFDFWVRLCQKYEIHVMPRKLVKFRVLDNNANASSGTPENNIRIQFEFLQILDHYRNLSSYEELVHVFPEAKEYRHRKYFNAQFALAMIAFKTRPFKFSALFSLNLLFELLNDPLQNSEIKEHYGFDLKKFRKMSGKVDLFGIIDS